MVGEREGPRGMDCPTCGAFAERGQLVCLECGSRIALSYKRPPSWKLPVAIVAVVSLLALGGALIAYEAFDSEAKQEVSQATLNPEEDTSPAAPETDAETEGTTQADTAEETDAEPAPKPEPEGKPKSDRPEKGADGLVKSGQLYTWPRSLDSFTVVVLSAEDRPSAIGFARQVASRGDAKAGVIRSDDFRTLPKGFFVVFAGSYPSRARADQAAVRLGRRYPGAFPQRVSR